MKTQKLNIKMTLGSCDCFVASLDDDGQYPAVLYYMDAFGLRDSLFEMCQKIATRGYSVLAPNLFYQQKRSPILSLSRIFTPCFRVVVVSV